MHPSTRAKLVYQQALYPNPPTQHSRPQSRPSSSMRFYQTQPPMEDDFYSDESSSCDSDCSCCDDMYEDQYAEQPHLIHQHRFHTTGHHGRSENQMISQPGRGSRQTMLRESHAQFAPSTQSRHRLHRGRNQSRMSHHTSLPQFHQNHQRRHSLNRTMDMQQPRYSHPYQTPSFSMPQTQQLEVQNPHLNVQPQNINTHQFYNSPLINQPENLSIQNQLNVSYRPMLSADQPIMHNPTLANNSGHLALHSNVGSLQTQNHQIAIGLQNRPNFVNTQVQQPMANQQLPQLRSGNPNMSPQFNMAGSQFQNYSNSQIHRNQGKIYQTQQQNLNPQMQQTSSKTHFQPPYPLPQNNSMVSDNQVPTISNTIYPPTRGSNNMTQIRVNSPYTQQAVPTIQLNPAPFNAPHINPQANILIESQPVNALQDENVQSAKLLYMMAKPLPSNQIQSNMQHSFALESDPTILHQPEVSKSDTTVRRDGNARYSQVNKTKKKLVTFDIKESDQTEYDEESQEHVAEKQNNKTKMQNISRRQTKATEYEVADKTSSYNEPSQESSIYEDPTALMKQSNKSSKKKKPKSVKIKENKKPKQVQTHAPAPTIANESIYEDPQEILREIQKEKVKTEIEIPRETFASDNFSNHCGVNEDVYHSLGKPPETKALKEPIYDHLSSMLTINTPDYQTSTSSSNQLKTDRYLKDAQITDTYMQLCKQNTETTASEGAMLQTFMKMHFPAKTDEIELVAMTENVTNFDKDAFQNSTTSNDHGDFEKKDDDELIASGNDSEIDIFDFEKIIMENQEGGIFQADVTVKQSDFSEDETGDSSEDETSGSSSGDTSSYTSDNDASSSDDSIGNIAVVKSQLFTMERELWRQCVRWLIDTGVISHLHKMAQPEAVVFDLAQTLRDGVVLFNLLNLIKPGAVDPNSINLRPQMLQFLCVQNLWAVKNSLNIVFKIAEDDLFLPSDLYNMTNVAKVLRCLSILSQIPCCASKYRPFPDMGIHRISQYRTDEEEDIYKNLSDMASERELMDEEEDLYDCVAEQKEEGIYGSLIASKPLPSPPKDKRSFCISEIYETEKNYVQHLKMMRDKFIHPFKTVMTDKDIKAIFINLEQLNPVHQEILNEIEKYKNDGSKMSRAFLNHKDGFLLYGTYCSNLADAQEYLATLMKHNEQTRMLVEDCQTTASPSKFKLRELLMVPMQRILKYHLLVKELNKHTTEKHQDKADLIKALDSMQEISQYVNEVKRDSETLVTINQVEKCLVDYTNCLPLSTYGRLLKDGELKIKMSNDRAIKTRNTFLFDQALFMTREKSGNYILKDLIRLDEYKLDELSVGSTRGGKWSFNWTLTAVTGTNSFILSAKAKSDKIKWVEKLKQAFDNIHPQALKGKSHSFKMHSFNEPTYCDSCKKLLLGSFYQGYICEKTEVKCHKTCLLNALKLVENNEGVDRVRLSDYPQSMRPNIPPEPPSRKPQPPIPNAIPASTPYKAHRKYSGVPTPPFGGNTIAFDIGEQIEVTEHTSSDWWKGYSLTHIERRGYFPASHVSPGQHKPEPKGKVRLHERHSTGEDTNYTVASPMPSTHVQLEHYYWYAGQLDRDGAAKKLAGRPTGTFLVRTRGDNMAISLLYQSDIKHIRIVKSAENLFYVAECKHFKSVQELVQFYEENSMSSSFLGLETTLKYPYRDPTMFPSERSSARVERSHSHLNDRLGSPPHLNAHRHRMSLPQFESHSPLPSNGIVQTPDGTRFDIMSKAKVLFDFDPRSPQELGLKAGQIVNIISKAGDAHGWWKGECNGNVGYFPASFIEEL